MNNPINPSQKADSLDHASQQYTRLKSGYSNQSELNAAYRHDIMLKNMYKQQLDDLVKQKEDQKRLEKERQMQERQKYNERAQYSQEAEKMKDLSYKNYYQMLLNNQASIAKNYSQLNYERDNQKDQLIKNGVQQEKQRSEQWWQAEQRRLENMKKHFRQGLDKQVNEKNVKSVQQMETRHKQQEQYKKITFTNEEVNKYERQRKKIEMSKYKQDLDKLTPNQSDKFRVMAGTAIVNNGSYAGNIIANNDFNIHQQTRHDPMINPMPFNIQNPYILKEFMRREQARHSQNNIFSSQN